MARPWFPFYFSDYAAKTEHLSLAEHGAYLLLMGAYYKRGCKLPANAVQLQKICSAVDDAEIAAMQSVLEQFFDKREDGYYHDRIELELQKSKDISKKRADAAKKRYEETAIVDANAQSNAGASVEVLQGDLQTQSQPQSHINKKQDLYDASFEDVWRRYPKRAGNNPKRAAWKAWQARRREGVELEALSAGVERYARFIRETGKERTEYVQMASTFFGPNRAFESDWKAPAKVAQFPGQQQEPNGPRSKPLVG